MKLTDRKEVIKDCLKKPFRVIFTLLGDYEDLDYDFETLEQATVCLNELIEESIKHSLNKELYDGYHAEIVKRIIIKSVEKE